MKTLWVVLLLSAGAYGQFSHIETITATDGTNTNFAASPFKITFSGCTVGGTGTAWTITCTGVAGNPGGSANQLQFNNSGTSFGGITNKAVGYFLGSAGSSALPTLQLKPYEDPSNDYSLDCTGVSAADTAITNAIAAGNQIVLPQGCIVNFASNHTFASTVNFLFLEGSEFAPQSSVTIITKGPVLAGERQQIVNTANGTVSFYGNAEIPCAWYGSLQDGVHDDAPGCEAAHSANPGKFVYLDPINPHCATGFGGGCISAGPDALFLSQFLLHSSGSSFGFKGAYHKISDGGAWISVPNTLGKPAVFVGPSCGSCELDNLNVKGASAWNQTDLTTFPLISSLTLSGIDNDGIVIAGGHFRGHNIGATNFARHGIFLCGDNSCPDGITNGTQAISTITVSSGTCTLTTVAAFSSIVAGEWVAVTGTSGGSGFNGVFQLTTAASPVMTYPCASSGSATGGQVGLSGTSAVDYWYIDGASNVGNRAFGIYTVGGDGGGGKCINCGGLTNDYGAIGDYATGNAGQNTWYSPGDEFSARDAISAGTTQAVSSISVVSTTCTLTTTAALANGVNTNNTWIVVTGSTGGTGFNGTFQVTSFNNVSQTLTYPCAATGGPASGGTVGTSSSRNVWNYLSTVYKTGSTPINVGYAYCSGVSMSIWISPYVEPSGMGTCAGSGQTLVIQPQMSLGTLLSGQQQSVVQTGNSGLQFGLPAGAAGSNLSAFGLGDTPLGLILQNGITADQDISVKLNGHPSTPGTYGSTNWLFGQWLTGRYFRIDSVANNPGDFALFDSQGGTLGLSSQGSGDVVFNNTTFQNGTLGSGNVKFFGNSNAVKLVINANGSLTQTGIVFASLPASTNGTLLYCTDCKNVADDSVTFDSTATGSGHGTNVLRENGAWRVH